MSGGSDVKDKFPYLKVEHLDEEDKKRLLGRLVYESKEIQFKFTSVVVQTVESLSSTITCENISSLKMSLEILKIPGISESDKVKELLSKTFKHCSFFSYGILKNVVSNFGTSNDKKILTEYESRFKAYCKRRLSEVPIDTHSSMQNKTKIYVKTDKFFDVPAEEVLELQSELSEMLGVPIYLCEWKSGCITLIFYTFHELDEIFPLKEKQIGQLKGIGVLKLFYSKSKGMYVRIIIALINIKINLAMITLLNTNYPTSPILLRRRRKGLVMRKSRPPTECSQGQAPGRAKVPGPAPLGQLPLY